MLGSDMGKGLPKAMLCALLVAGCGSKGAVTLTARVESPELSVTQGALVQGLAGGFDLVLSLGDVASKGTSVNAPTFSVVQGDLVVLSPLRLDASETFPVAVEPGR